MRPSAAPCLSLPAACSAHTCVPVMHRQAFLPAGDYHVVWKDDLSGTSGTSATITVLDTRRGRELFGASTKTRPMERLMKTTGKNKETRREVRETPALHAQRSCKEEMSSGGATSFHSPPKREEGLGIQMWGGVRKKPMDDGGCIFNVCPLDQTIGGIPTDELDNIVKSLQNVRVRSVSTTLPVAPTLGLSLDTRWGHERRVWQT